MPLKDNITAKRATNAKQLAQCENDHACKKLVIGSGKPHAMQNEDFEWMPCIGMFIIHHWFPFSDERTVFVTEHDATEKARELNREWKKEVNK